MYRKTLLDIRNLELGQYDLIVTDFEPVVAWSGRLRGRPVIGIGHQYAFNYSVPLARGRLVKSIDHETLRTGIQRRRVALASL